MTSNLYQVPFSTRDLEKFQTLQRQPRVGPRNCASVSLYLLSLMNRPQAEANANRRDGVWFDELVKYIGEKHDRSVNFISHHNDINIHNLNTIYDRLFNNFATVVLATRRDHAIGHYFVFYKHADRLHIIDAQLGEIYSDLAGIDEYLTKTGLDDQFYYVLIGPTKTSDEFESLFIDNIIADLLQGCLLYNAHGGKRKVKKQSLKKQRKLKKKKTRKN